MESGHCLLKFNRVPSNRVEQGLRKHYALDILNKSS